MNLATWSIRNPVPVILLFTLLALAGWRGFQQLVIQDLPDLDLPAVNITLVQPGAAAAQLETEVARKVEDSVAALTGVQHITTAISEGRVDINVEFELSRKLPEAVTDAKDAVDRVRADLPVDLQPPIVTAVLFGDAPLLTYAVSAPSMDEEALSWFVDDVVSKALRGVSGVAQIARVGGVDREILIELDPSRLTGLGLTAGDVSSALQRGQQQSSGGRAQIGGGEQSVRTLATVKEASDLNAYPLALEDGRQLRLDQVARVQDGAAERTQKAILDGKIVVGFDVMRAKGGDAIKISEAVEHALAALSSATPGLVFTQIASTVDYTREQYHGSLDMLLEGSLLTVLVVFLFLRDWRATLIAAAALPLSILPTFAVMSWLGYSLNTLTLMAIAVVVGILVDDAIVEIENIERHRRLGKSVREATSEAVTEIALAVMATTLTLVVVFIPTALMGGIAGLLFSQFGWTVVIAVLASLLVARLLTPLMAAYLLKDHAPKPERDGWVMRRYLGLASWCLRHRLVTLGGAGAFLVISVFLVAQIPGGAIPATDSGYSSVSIELTPGSAFADTERAVERVRVRLADVGGIASTFATVGVSSGGEVSNEVRRGSVTMKLVERAHRPPQSEVEREVRTALTGIPGVKFSVGSGGPGEQLILILASDDAVALRAGALAFTRDLRSVPQLANVTSTANLERPEVVVRPDLARAAERGVSAEAMGETVRIATSGDFIPQLSKLNLDNRQIPIRVRLPDHIRGDIEAIASLRVSSRDGLVPLATVATLSVESGPSQIDRYDRRRLVTVSADLAGAALGDAVAAAMATPAARSLPSNVALVEAGDAEMAAEMGEGFGVALLTGILGMFCVLILLFKDVFQPFTILSAIPLSFGGAFIALLVTDSQLDIPALIGLVMLIGIVTKNSILLVEYAVVGIRDRGLSITEGLLSACHNRARPIVMTTLAMIAGMLPVAMGLGADASFRQPMAVAVIGGLITSTLLSLIVVPVVFTVMAGIHRRLVNLFSQMRTPRRLRQEDRGA